MQIDLPESTEDDPGSFVHFPVVLGQGRGGKLSFLQYDRLFARTTAAQFDEAGKETKAGDAMTDGDLDLICSPDGRESRRGKKFSCLLFCLYFPAQVPPLCGSVSCLR